MSSSSAFGHVDFGILSCVMSVLVSAVTARRAAVRWGSPPSLSRTARSSGERHHSQPTPRSSRFTWEGIKKKNAQKCSFFSKVLQLTSVALMRTFLSSGHKHNYSHTHTHTHTHTHPNLQNVTRLFVPFSHIHFQSLLLLNGIDFLDKTGWTPTHTHTHRHIQMLYRFNMKCRMEPHFLFTDLF